MISQLGVAPIDDRSPTLPRRSLLRLAGMSTVVAMAGCAAGPPRQSPSEPAPRDLAIPGEPRKVLLAYYSRAGWNYQYGGRTYLETGNTEVAVGMISKLIGCDVYRIEAADPYPDDYDQTVERNVREQNNNARPAIASPLPPAGQYGTVLLGSGIWNVRAPMIMSTFAESYDFTGKTIHPITTHAMSGLGTTERDYAASCPGAIIGEGLAIRGEEVKEAGPALESWLRHINLL